MTKGRGRQESGGASRCGDAPQRNRECVWGRLYRAAGAAWQIGGQVSGRFGRDGCSLMAAATAYYGLLSLIPLGALAISVFGRILGSSAEAERQVLAMLEAGLPLQAPAMAQAIRQVTYPTGRWFLELVSVLGLVWSGSRLFHTLEDVLTRVWAGHGRGRSLFLRNLVALAATVGAGAIFLAMMLATAVAASLASVQGALAGLPLALGWLLWLRRLAPIAGAWVMFLMMYRFLPQERGRWRETAIGAGTAALLWEASRVAFARLVAQSAAYGRVYGSLAGVVVLAIWIYVTAAILLVGAELAVVLQERRKAEEG